MLIVRALGTRTRSKFMVETLVNVKNNKMRAIPGGEIAAEATQKMKRFLGGLTKKKHSKYPSS